MRVRIGRLIAAIASATLMQVASPAHAEPAMWVVKDADSTIYLLGTFHLIKPDMNWRSDKIDAAFKESDELWLEASPYGDEAMLQKLVLKHGFDPQHPLSGKLSGDDWAKVQSAAGLGGVPVKAVEQMRPWLAALTLVVAPMMKEGYDPKKGADKQLEDSAKAGNKVVRTFETPEQQLLFFSSLPKQSELDFLVQTLDEIAAGPKYVDRMADAWLAGDTGELEAMTLNRMKEGAPKLYDALIVQRNIDWCNQIATVMKGAGTSFVAVGAGHLVGDQSVPAILAERGFAVTPY
ncbi:MAG TPA: TraB/GumN family protein [Dongiaceae bacterium]|nr:TraB/GumN family protein [Dongiaceae bacterium]